MKVPEVCNANMTSLSIDIVHSLIKSQTSFQAGELGVCTGFYCYDSYA